MNIYGEYEKYLELILETLSKEVYKLNDEYKNKTGYKLFEHFISTLWQVCLKRCPILMWSKKKTTYLMLSLTDTALII